MKKDFLDSLLSAPQLSGSQVSPDGTKVAWVWSNIGAHENVYCAPTDGSAEPLQITDFGENTTVVSWSRDSALLVVKHDYSGDERYRLYMVDVETGKTTPLTEEHPDYFIRGGALHPNGRYLFYGANYDFKTGTVLEPTVVYRHDLVTGERLALSSPERPCFSVPELNRDGTHVVYQRSDRNPSGTHIWLADTEGVEDKEILNFGDTAKVFASWFPDGERIAFLAEAETHRRVGVYNMNDGGVEWIFDDSLRNIEGVHVPERSNDLVILESENARDFASLVNLSTRNEIPLRAPGTLLPLAPIQENEWACVHFSSTQPTDIVSYAIGKKEITRSISNVRKKIDFNLSDLVQAEDYWWKSTDGLDIQGWLYKTRRAHPKGTIIFVHGGPTGNSEDRINPTIQYFVSEGFTVLDPNYRGSTGFGFEFQERIKEDHSGGMEQIDILEGIRALIQDGIAEPYKVGIIGTSYGGYSAWHAITHFSTEYIQAAVPICGMTDLVLDYETTRPDLRKHSEEMFGGSPKTNPQIYYERSPINFIENIKGKLLIVQGARDPNVTLDNVIEVEKRLKEHAVLYEKLIFDDEGHGIRKPQNKKIMLTTAAKFFEDAFSET